MFVRLGLGFGVLLWGEPCVMGVEVVGRRLEGGREGRRGGRRVVEVVWVERKVWL